MNKNLNTVIFKKAQKFSDLADDSTLFSELDSDVELFSEDSGDNSEDSEDYYLEFSEGESLDDEGEGYSEDEGEEYSEGDDTTVDDVLHGFLEGEETLGDLAEMLNSAEEDIKDLSKEHGDETISEFSEDFIPGSDAREGDFADDSEEEDDGDYLTTGNIKKFMEYITDTYPGKIPRHDGKTTLGCERAKSFLERVDKEISSAIRKDHDGILEISKLEDIRQKIMSDISKLTNHIKMLKSKDNKKKASIDPKGIPFWTDASGVEHSYSDLRKTAATPSKMVIAVPPFERAIAGIMINAHVSAGHNMEEVYDYLANKYAITPREELSIMQVCMDSGFHIFKDRGTYSGEKEDKEDSTAKRGVDFVRNYFA